MILIIGAGLSGLLTAYRLKERGIPCKILEARNRVGGRIHTVYSKNNAPFEMGATWFNSQHKHLLALLEELEIDYFQQHMDESVFFQASANSDIQSFQLPPQSPSYRVAGGTANIVNSLFQKLDGEDVLFNQPVKGIEFNGDSVRVLANDSFEASSIVLAIPPKLWVSKIAFAPALPSDLITIAKETHTWMEDSIKLALTYKEAFWKQENRSATFFSKQGPVIELFDHTDFEGSKFALCGFIHSAYAKLPDLERHQRVMAQLEKAFGSKVKEFSNFRECIWSKEKDTFQHSGKVLAPHQNNGHPIYRETFVDDKLFISSSEAAAVFPGYMEGAVHIGNLIAEKIANAKNSLS